MKLSSETPAWKFPNAKQSVMKVVAENLRDGWMRFGRSVILLVVFSLFLLPSGCAYQLRQTREAAEGLPVLFRYEEPGAKEVSIVADFTRWEPQPMVGKGGTWSFEVPLSPGRYLYGFLVDGQFWKADPGAMLFDDDGFGKRNSVLLVE
jgi:hypothetical protein